jgi:hypothetical protein
MKGWGMFKFACGVALVMGMCMSAAYAAGGPRGGGEDANAAVRNQALALAAEEYIGRYGPARDAMEGPVTANFKIGYAVPEFAAAGDTIWEVRYMLQRDGLPPGELRAFMWVNPTTKKVWFISGMKGDGNPAAAKEAPAAARADDAALAKEATAAYREIAAKVAAGDIAGAMERVLDNGELLKPTANRAEATKDLEKEQTFLTSEAVKGAKAGESKVQRREVNGKEVITVTWRLEGTAEYAKSVLPRGGRTPTLAEDGTLVVYMKKIEGKWMWNPFGW